jgi:signal transduction histidine kinase
MPNGNRIYRLLIVDDDETDRRLYGWLLARQAPGVFEIEPAVDGAAGIAALRARQFDCVLLDFSLPDVTGLEFLIEAAVDGELPSAVVLITGHGNEAIAVEAMKLGVQDYLVKDHVNEGRLWRAIERAISQRELRQRLAQSARALRAANATLEQEVAAHRTTETALRAAKEAAEQADRTKSRFVAMVTHELRGPLHRILRSVQSLRVEGGLTPRQNEVLGEVMLAGRHLFGMVERVLDSAGIETGRIELHPEPVAVGDLMDNCLASMGPAAADRGLSLRLVRAHDAPGRIVADPARLRQVLLNLLDNAIKFTAAGGVELRVLPADAAGALRIEVADSGPGVGEAARDRLFQDFERLDAPAAQAGAGLGLAVSARFAGLMGGAIGYIPNPAGGSIFWLELPPGELVSRAPPAQDAVGPTVGGRVLLVDDIAMNRDVLGAFLRAAGCDVRLAENGQDAVRIAAEAEFDLILMDVRMPEMDGLEATRRIRALPAPHGLVPILALTAWYFPEQIAQCREAGMDGHVAKPVDQPTLLAAVARAIGRVPADPATESPRVVQVEADEAPLARHDRPVCQEEVAFAPGGAGDVTPMVADGNRSS